MRKILKINLWAVFLVVLSIIQLKLITLFSDLIFTQKLKENPGINTMDLDFELAGDAFLFSFLLIPWINYLIMLLISTLIKKLSLVQKERVLIGVVYPISIIFFVLAITFVFYSFTGFVFPISRILFILEIVFIPILYCGFVSLVFETFLHFKNKLKRK